MLTVVISPTERCKCQGPGTWECKGKGIICYQKQTLNTNVAFLKSPFKIMLPFFKILVA